MGLPATRTRAPMTQAAAARNLGGQGDRPRSHFERRCGSRQARNSSTSPATRTAARAGEEGGDKGFGPLTAAVESDAVQLHAMVNEAEAELFGDLLLKILEILIDEFYDVARLDIDQMVVMRVRRCLVA